MKTEEQLWREAVIADLKNNRAETRTLGWMIVGLAAVYGVLLLILVTRR